MAELPVPTHNEVEAIYGLERGAEASQRYQQLATAFKQTFGAEPEHFARAPGRVNLIGEHIDYEGYAVLPMAVRQDTVVAIRRGGTKLAIANLDSKYPLTELSTDPNQPVNAGKHSWTNYVLSAYKGVYDHLEAKGAQPPPPTGLQMMVHGTVPTGSGLSSSAAIVVSSALAVLAAHGIQLTKGEVAAFACKAEQYVGVTAGGMDQAISVMAMPGVAMLVEFNPVRATDVQLPPGSCFVVANSLTVSNKHDTADKRYNLRVVECRLAAAVMARKLGLAPAEAAAITTLQEIEALISGKYGPGLQGQQEAVADLLHTGAYMQAEVEEELGVKLEEVYAGRDAPLRVLKVAAADGYQLRNRAAHVYSEAARVHEFKAVCDGTAAPEEKLRELGRLMDASHASCGALYECSCPELEELVGVARAAGALGARLTGAGWGGCTVSLVKEGDVTPFLEALRSRYFAKCIAEGRVREEEMSDTLFATKPGAGAAVMQLDLAPAEQAAVAKEAVLTG